MIKLNDKYYLDSDGRQYIIKEKQVVKDKNSKNYGKENYINKYYYSSLKNIKKDFFEQIILENIELLNNIDKVIELKEELEKLDINIK